MVLDHEPAHPARMRQSHVGDIGEPGGLARGGRIHMEMHVDGALELSSPLGLSA